MINKLKEWLKRIKRKYPMLKSDIETDVLIIGNGIQSALIGYEFFESNIRTVVIDKDIIYQSPINDDDDEEFIEDTKLINSMNEKDKLEVFELMLESVYKLDDISSRLKNKYNYSRKPGLNFYKFVDEQDDINLYKRIINYNFGVKMNHNKFIKQLFKFLVRKGHRVYSKTEIVFFSKDDNNNIIAMTNTGYKIRCKRIINTYGEHVYPSNNTLVDKYEPKIGSSVIDSILNAKYLVSKYLNIKDESLRLLRFDVK